nr:hypothetical protein [Tanacetum cinerariifolium]
TSAKVKTINEDVRLQALVDVKKVIINEASIRSDLRLDDAEAFFSPQWKFLIHAILQFLSAKTTAWNEFSSTMASTIICLANNQKFNFSKNIFESMMKNLEVRVMFLMYSRFVQVSINNQLGDMSHHKGIFINPSLTKNVFANVKRVETGFSGEITPLFETMMVQAPKEVGEIPTDIQHIPILTQPSSSQPQRKHKLRRRQRKEIKVSQDEPPIEENIPTPSHDPLPSGEGRLKLNELMEIFTKLSDKILSLEQILTNHAAKIEKLKKILKKLEGKKKKITHRLKRIYKVGLSARIISSDEEGLGDPEDASKQERIAEIDADKDLSLINETTQDQGMMNDQDMFRVNDLNDDEVVVDVSAGEKEEQSDKVAEKEVSTADLVTTAGEGVTTANFKVSAALTTTTTDDELTSALTLIEIKVNKPKALTTAATTVTAISTRPKEKGIIMQEPSKTPSPKTIVSS